MSISKERLDWAVMQAKSELARQDRNAFVRDDGMVSLATFDLRALVAVVLEAGDALLGVEASAYRSGMMSPDDLEYVNNG